MGMVLACAAHWWESMLFVAPVGLVAAAMRWSTWRADREEEHTALPEVAAG